MRLHATSGSIASIENAPGAAAFSSFEGSVMSSVPVNKSGERKRVGSVCFVDNRLEFFVTYKRCTKCEQRFSVSLTKSEAEEFARSMGLFVTKEQKRNLKKRFYIKLRDYLQEKVEG